MLGAQAHKCKDDEETKTAERSVECRGCGGFADPPSPSVSHTKKDPENRASSDYENFPTRREKGGGGHSAKAKLTDASSDYEKFTNLH